MGEPAFSPSPEDRLKRLEELMDLILRRLESIERLLREEEKSRGEIRVAIRLLSMSRMPLSRALDLAGMIARILSSLDQPLSDVEASVLEVVAARPGISVSGIDRELRRIRGRSSRRTVMKALRRLVLLGLVRLEYDGRRYRAYLASDVESVGKVNP